MTEDDLKAIELRAKAALATPSEYDALWTGAVLETDVPALVAEVRRLRKTVGDGYLAGWRECIEYIRHNGPSFAEMMERAKAASDKLTMK